MAGIPGSDDESNNFSDKARFSAEQIRTIVRKELDLAATDMLNLIQEMFDHLYEDIKMLNKSLWNESEIQWKNHHKTIQKAMKKHFIKNFPGPIEVIPTPKGFLADSADADLETGTESERFQKRWTRELYNASFQPLNMTNQQREDMKVLLDKPFRNFFQNFRSHITGDNPSTGIGKVQESLKKALEQLSDQQPADPKRAIEGILAEHQNKLIAMFEVSNDIISKRVRQNINRALLLGEGCSSGCQTRAQHLFGLIEEICRAGTNEDAIPASFVNDDTAASSRTAVEQSLSRFTGFNQQRLKRRRDGDQQDGGRSTQEIE